jgi:hypothetical protein
MTIRYSSGRTVHAVLLVRKEKMIRAVPQGSDDVVEFNEINGTWVSDDCEPVHIEFAWQSRKGNLSYSEEDFVTSHDLASRLIHLSRSGAIADSSWEQPAAQPAITDEFVRARYVS